MQEDIFSDAIDNFNQFVGFEELVIEPGSYVYLASRLGNSITLQWRSDVQKLYSYGTCSAIYNGINSDIFYNLLCANFAWNETDGSTLSVDRRTDSIVLIDMNGAELFRSAEIFYDYLGRFLNKVDYWHEHIKTYQSKVTHNSDGAHGLSEGLLRTRLLKRI
jgi:hypothetical protein